MKFSIIIPAHNSEAYIRKALDSIRMQTYTDYELIVVCDSCTDSTESIAKNYGAITENVSFGCDGPTRSVGLDLATADWILFMDDDDWWVRPDVLEILAWVIDGSSFEFDILAFSFEWPNYIIATPRGNNGYHWPAVWTKCWSREFIGDTRFPDVPMESDFKFWQDMAAKGPLMAEINTVMYHYNYMRTGSQTERKTNDHRS